MPRTSIALPRPVLVGPDVAQLVAGAHRVGRPRAARAAEPDVELARLRASRPSTSQSRAGAVEDDALAVGGGVAGVELAGRVDPVAAQVAAVGRAGVQVGDALVVGQEREPVADPHRRGQVAVEVGLEAGELPAAVRVEPQLAGGAAAVALPPRGFAGERAEQQDRAVRARARGRRPARTAAGASRCRRRRPRRPSCCRIECWPTVLAGEDGGAVRGPAEHLGVDVAPVGEPAARAAVGRRQVHLRLDVAPAGPGELGAVRGEARRARRAAWSAETRQARPPSSGASHTSSSATKVTRSPCRWG